MRPLFISVLCLLAAVDGRGNPPKLIIPSGNSWHQSTIYIRSGESLIIQCRANNPLVTYKWTVNGGEISDYTSKVTFDPVSGNLSISTTFNSDSDGDYQCIAMNNYGKTMTPYLTLKATRADTFGGSVVTTPETSVVETDYLELKCENVPESVPPWDFSWGTLTFNTNGYVGQTQAVVENERLAIDKNGALHILWLEQGDEKVYACFVFNTVLLLKVRNTQNIKLTVTPKSRDVERDPLLKYNPDVTVYVGTPAVLTCIFTYYSSDKQLSIVWYHRGEIVGHDRSITIPTMRYPTDPAALLQKEGEYLCEATLGKARSSGKVVLTIVALTERSVCSFIKECTDGIKKNCGEFELRGEPPQFLPYKSLSSISVPVEKNAVFRCEAESRHSYAGPPVWLLNTVPLLGCPPRFFECKQGLSSGLSQCISESKRCDTYPDCSDDSDEINCEGTASCPESQKRCGDKCVLDHEKCDQGLCDYPAFLCYDKRTCLRPAQVCNSKDNCLDGSDEIDCPNGTEIVIQNLRFNSQRTQLTVPNLELTDTMCLQCLITNEFGTSFSDGCLTVIEKIRVQKGPNSTYDVQPGYNLTIDVAATTDAEWQNQMKYKWFYYEEVDDQKTGEKTLVAKLLPIPNLGKYYRLSTDNGKHIMMLFPMVEANDKAAYDVYCLMKDRMYSVVIEHIFDRVEMNFTVKGLEIIAPNKIVVLKRPNSTYDVEPGYILTIDVDATTDAEWQNQMIYTWLWYEKEDDQKTSQKNLVAKPLPIQNLGKYFRLSLDGKHMLMVFPMVQANDKDAYDDYNLMKDRMYSVVIKHSNVSVELNFTVNGLEIKPNKIVVLRGPNSTYDIDPGYILTIDVDATSDAEWQNQMTYTWLWYEKEDDQKTSQKNLVAKPLPIQNLGKYFRLSLDGKHMLMVFPMVQANDKDAYDDYNLMKDRMYSVVIKHSNVSVELNFTVNGLEIKPNKIVVLRGPNSTYDINPGYILTIDVDATSDAEWQNQMTYTWLWYEKEDDQKTSQKNLVAKPLPIQNLGKYFRLSLDGKHMLMVFPMVQANDKDAYDDYYLMKDRMYSVVIKHSNVSVELNFTVNGLEIKQIVKSAPTCTDLWFIAFILAILLLIIVVALVVFYMYRKQAYPLDKKEQQADHDPEQRVDADYDTKTHGEAASMSERDFDVSKCNEDASFIGIFEEKKCKDSSCGKPSIARTSPSQEPTPLNVIG